MSTRLPLALALALGATACAPPAPASNSYDQKVAKVEQLTKALSLSQNEELKQATASMQTLGSSMTQGGFANATAAAGGLVAAGGGNMVAAGGGNIVGNAGGNIVGNAGGNMVAAGGGNYLLTALVQDLNAGVRKDIYGLLGTVEGAAGSSITYDDATGELTGISDATTAATFRFVNEGAKRSWVVTILRSPDGTTGTMTFEVAADTWRAASGPAQAPTTDANADPNGWWGSPSPAPDFGDDTDPVIDPVAPDEAPDADENPDFGLTQAAPPFTIFNNEVPDPNTLTSFRFACDLTPQGDAKLRVKIDALIDDVKQVQAARMPTHLKLDLTVPTVQFTSNTNFDGAVAFASQGGLKVRTPEAIESLKYDLDMRLGANTGKLDLVHENAKVRMGLVASQGAKPGVPQTKAALYDTETNAKIADLEPATGEPNVMLIKFTNGKTVRWDIAGGTTTGLTGATGTASGGLGASDPVRPAQAPTPRPTGTPFRI